MTDATQATPRAYFADLAAYNAGKLHGVWIDFMEGIEPDDVQVAIASMLQGHEEWEIHDIESFAGVTSTSIERLCQIAALIHKHGEEAVRGYLGHLGDDADLDEFTEHYIGEYESEEEFCEEHLGIAEAAEKIQVFDWATLDQYIDWEAIANDAFINLYYAHKASHSLVHVYTR